MEWAAKGAAAMANADTLPTALHCYTQALIEHPHSPDYFTKRAAIYTRMKPQRHDLALKDAEYGVLLGQKRAKREKIQAAQQRRVVALYGLGRYEDAKYLLNTMKTWRKTGDAGKADQMEHDMWMAKINNKLKNKTEVAHTVDEYPKFDLPSEKEIKNWLQGQVNANGTVNIDASEVLIENKPTKDEYVEQSEKDESKRDTTAEATSVEISKLQAIRNDFFQNNDNVIVTFYAKKVDPTSFICSIESDSVKISFPHPENKSSTFTYVVEKTFGAIDVANSTSKVFGTKIELRLAKSEKGIKWPALEAKDKPTMQTLPNPYASKSTTDWDKKAAQLTQKPAKPDNSNKHDDADSDADSEYGGDAVDGFFKKLYAGADDDTRRAMMKSFQESNGTSLSTNWSEVSKGHVDEVKSKDEN